MKKVLVISGHTDLATSVANKTILNTISQRLPEAEIVKLDTLYPNFRIDVDAEQQRLLNKQQELQNLDNQLAQELMQEQQKLNEQLRDTVVSQLKAFNLGRGYQVVFSNTVGDNILLAGDSYDITGELLEYLNKNYSSPAK